MPVVDRPEVVTPRSHRSQVARGMLRRSPCYIDWGFPLPFSGAHMHQFESPTYVLDLRHSLNRATIESAKPNKKIRVLVIPEDDPSAEPIAADGTLSPDGKLFHVVV